jgi:UDP-N-acetyl-D-mannosaminuronic acid transferase (WecB/TagA/CpsF family)
MSGFRGLDGIHAQTAGLIRRAGKNFEIQTHEDGYNWREDRNQAQSKIK